MNYTSSLSHTEEMEQLLAARRSRWEDLIRERTSPLEAIPTGVETRMPRFYGPRAPEIKAVLFDVYGTLLISGSGEVGSAADTASREDTHAPFYRALSEAGFSIDSASEGFEEKSYSLYVHSIKMTHAALKEEGISSPEVDILNIWRKLIENLSAEGLLSGACGNERLIEASLRYELYANRIWPMPGALELLAALQQRGYLLGIVSNAQYYTPLILETFLGKNLQEAGFLPELCAWSYRKKLAKPSTELFTEVLAALEQKGVASENTLYVGNDMLNDISPAARLGCKTVLFAGDKRSLRLREEMPELHEVKADAIIDTLSQISVLLGDIQKE